jgi:hypothetical protein
MHSANPQYVNLEEFTLTIETGTGAIELGEAVMGQQSVTHGQQINMFNTAYHSRRLQKQYGIKTQSENLMIPSMLTLGGSRLI